MITSGLRGHKIYFKNGQWFYLEDNTPITKEKPCIRCGKMPTKEGYDACLGHINGVESACCGHGMTEPIMIGAI